MTSPPETYRGPPDGDRYGTPGDVVYVGTEDDWSSVLVPRSTAVDADLDRVHLVEMQNGAGFSVDTDLPESAAAIESSTVFPRSSLTHSTRTSATASTLTESRKCNAHSDASRNSRKTITWRSSVSDTSTKATVARYSNACHRQYRVHHLGTVSDRRRRPSRRRTRPNCGTRQEQPDRVSRRGRGSVPNRRRDDPTEGGGPRSRRHAWSGSGRNS